MPLHEPQTMIMIGYGRLSSLSRDQGQRWCGVASVKRYRTALVTDRTALVAGWRDQDTRTSNLVVAHHHNR